MSENIRVLHTLASINNLSAGPSYSVPALIASQNKIDIDATLHCLRMGGLTAKSTNSFLHKRDYDWAPGLKKLGTSREMKSYIMKTKCDIIHTHGLWLGVNTYTNTNSKFIITPRGMMTPVALKYSPLKKKISRVLFQNKAFLRASLIHVTSWAEYEDVRRYGLKSPVAIIPNGISPVAAPINSDQSDYKTILSLGRIHPKKNLSSLILAWSKLEKLYPSWRLMIIGPDQNQHQRELEALTARQGLNRVFFGEPIHNVEKERMLAQSELFVLPSHSENFAMTVAESLAHGTPVIASKGTPWSELDRRGCGWWVDNSPEALAEAISNALSISDQQRSLMGKRGAEWMAKDYSWEHIAIQMKEVYMWLLGKSSMPPTVQLN